MLRVRISAIALLFVAFVSSSPRAVSPIAYRFTFPEPQHRWMQVEATFPDLSSQPLELRMSRSSPGRYSLHDFAKNVYDVRVVDADGRELATTRPDASGWEVAKHGTSVTVKYKVYGDRLDGTYLAVDTTHAHINMPAVIMWARGFDDRPAMLTFERPRGVADWRVATQLHPAQQSPAPIAQRPSSDAAAEVFTAPNLQYLMDSPVEFGPVAIREFSVDGHRFRFALHHAGTDAELDAYVKDVQKIVVQEGAVFGEYPQYEPGYYVFLADYLPYASGDGMEHRNSTVMTGAASLRNPGEREMMLGTVSHEFFHCWNVERIRPRSLEPFDFDRPNMSSELWLAEGFTQYYGELLLHRAGVVGLSPTLAAIAQLAESVAVYPGREFRSAVESSQMAPFVDGARPIDRTNWSNTVMSYYPFGGAIALALDLSLRDRTDGRTTLDDFMRSMWRVHGRPAASREGYVDRPYTVADAEARLADVAGDPAFARTFFSKYVEGHDLAGYGPLLARAGLVLRRRDAGQAWIGDLHFDEKGGGVHVRSLVAPNAPAYGAGLEQDDEIRQLDGNRIGAPDQIAEVLRRHRPGDRVDLVFVDRRSSEVKTTIALAENPHLEVVPAEAIGGSLTPAQRSFRESWLGPRPAPPTTPPGPR